MSERTEGEVAAIFARLKEEVRGTPGAARSRAERAWAVTADRPFEAPPTRRSSVQRWLVVPMKRLLRKSIHWYVEPLAADQRSFNLAVLNLVDELAERFEADLDRLERRLEALEARRNGDEPAG